MKNLEIVFLPVADFAFGIAEDDASYTAGKQLIILPDTEFQDLSTLSFETKPSIILNLLSPQLSGKSHFEIHNFAYVCAE